MYIKVTSRNAEHCKTNEVSFQDAAERTVHTGHILCVLFLVYRMYTYIRQTALVIASLLAVFQASHAALLRCDAKSKNSSFEKL